MGEFALEYFYLALGCVAVLAVCLWLGRVFGGVWMMVFVVLMAIVGSGLFASFFFAQGRYAGVVELVVLVFLWAPALVSGLIGAGIGWWMKVGRDVDPS